MLRRLRRQWAAVVLAAIVLALGLEPSSRADNGFTDTATASGVTLGGDVIGLGNANTVAAISGSTPIAITPNSLQWTNGTAAPTLTQAALASTSAGSGATGQAMSVTAQAGQAATGASNNGGAGGALTLSSGAGGTSGSATKGVPGAITLSTNGTSGSDGSSINFANGATNYLQLSETANGATVQLLMPATQTNLVWNVSNASQTIQFVSPSGRLNMGATAALSLTLGGVSGTNAFAWSSASVALTSGASNVLTNAQYNNPHIKFTGTLTGAGTTVTFPATDGACWDLDFSAVVTIADSIALIANSNTWSVAVASVGTEYPHVCYSAGAGKLVGVSMVQ